MKKTMTNLNFVCLFVLVVLSGFSVESRRSSGTRRTSNSRSSSRAVPTHRPAYAQPTASHKSYNTQSSGYYNTPRKSNQVPSTPRSVVRTQPTVRHYPTQKPVYHQPSYTQKPVYHQPSYTQKPIYNQQTPYGQKPAYPQQNYPKQNYPSYSQPAYKPYQPYQPSYSGGFNNMYSPGGFAYKRKKDHGVRNAVLAGLGGSALGMYLGYKLGGYTHSQPYGGQGYGGGYAGGSGYAGNAGNAGNNMPSYSVVHHYHHGEKPIVQNAQVEPNVIAQCQGQSFCTPGSEPLCMTNGTIYCVTPVSQTINCNVNSTNLQCINATITAPCLNENDTDCNSTALATENVSIPCVSSIDVFGDFGTNKLSVHSASDGSQNSQGTLTNQGINNKYCVTVIAEPLVEPKNLTNEEFAQYLYENPQVKQETDVKVDGIMDSIARYMLY